MKKIRLLVVDDLAAVRQELTSLLQLASKRAACEIEIVGEARDGEDALQKAGRLHPDVVLMDLEMPVMDGHEATRQMKAAGPAARIVILSIHDGTAEKDLACRAGADAFVTKGGSVEGLLNAILGRDGPIVSFDSEKGENK